jgi:hypothetical protein
VRATIRFDDRHWLLKVVFRNRRGQYYRGGLR